MLYLCNQQSIQKATVIMRPLIEHHQFVRGNTILFQGPMRKDLLLLHNLPCNRNNYRPPPPPLHRVLPDHLSQCDNLANCQPFIEAFSCPFSSQKRTIHSVRLISIFLSLPLVSLCFVFCHFHIDQRTQMEPSF